MLLTSILSDRDLYLFNEGSHERLYEKLARIPWKANRPGSRILPCGLPTPVKSP